MKKALLVIMCLLISAILMSCTDNEAGPAIGTDTVASMEGEDTDSSAVDSTAANVSAADTAAGDAEKEDPGPATIKPETGGSSAEINSPATVKAGTITPAAIKNVKVLTSHSFTGDDCIVTYLAHEIVKDIENKDALKITFQFTNTTESNDIPSGLFDIWAYQYDAGLNFWIELDAAYPMIAIPSDILDIQNTVGSAMSDLHKEVKSGATVNISVYFQLKNKTLVNIVVANWDYNESDPNMNDRYSLGLIEVVDGD